MSSLPSLVLWSMSNSPSNILNHSLSNNSISSR